MTANQVAFAVTNEQARHNLKSEELAKYSADIEATKAEYQRSYQERDLEIKRQYNDAYTAYLKGDLEEKERHQQAMDDLTAAKQENERWYQNIALGLDKQKIAAQKQYQQDTIRMQERNADLLEKKYSYDRDYQNATISSYLLGHQIDALKANQSYNLGLLDAAARMEANHINLLELKSKGKYYNAKALEALSGAVRNTLDAAGTISSKLLLLGGL